MTDRQCEKRYNRKVKMSLAPKLLSVGAGFILFLFSVWYVKHRPDMGRPNGRAKFSALRGSDKAGIGLERCLCVKECRHGEAGV